MVKCRHLLFQRGLEKMLNLNRTVSEDGLTLFIPTKLKFENLDVAVTFLEDLDKLSGEINSLYVTAREQIFGIKPGPMTPEMVYRLIKRIKND